MYSLFQLVKPLALQSYAHTLLVLTIPEAPAMGLTGYNVPAALYPRP